MEGLYYFTGALTVKKEKRTGVSVTPRKNHEIPLPPYLWFFSFCCQQSRFAPYDSYIYGESPHRKLKCKIRIAWEPRNLLCFSLFTLTVNNVRNIKQCPQHHVPMSGKITYPLDFLYVVISMKLEACVPWQCGICFAISQSRSMSSQTRRWSWRHQWSLVGKWRCKMPVWGEMNQLWSPAASCGRLLISSTCTTCSSDKYEAGVCFNQRSYSVGEMVRPWCCW